MPPEKSVGCPLFTPISLSKLGVDLEKMSRKLTKKNNFKGEYLPQDLQKLGRIYAITGL